MRIIDRKTGETIDVPTDKGLQTALARRICEIKGIKGK